MCTYHFLRARYVERGVVPMEKVASRSTNWSRRLLLMAYNQVRSGKPYHLLRISSLRHTRQNKDDTDSIICFAFICF